MPNCGSNTLLLSRPSEQTSGSCPASGGCNGSGPLDPVNARISQRTKRGLVAEQVKDYVLLMLGAPTVRVELDQQALDMVVEQTLAVMEYYAPSDFFKYHVFTTTPGKSVYEMPPDVGYIRQVSYRTTGTDFAFQSTDLDGAIPIEYFYPGGAYASIQGGLIDPLQPIWGRAGDWVLYKMYERMYSRLSSALGGWEFLGGYRFIKIYPIPFRAYKVIVHYMQRKYDWDQVTLAMQEGAYAMAQMVIGNIRKKYPSPPGPGGGIQLDGAEMYAEGKENYRQWKEDLIYKFGEPLAITTG